MRTLYNCPTSCETCLMWILVEVSSCSDWSALFWGGVFAPDMSFEGLVASLTDFERSVAEGTRLIDGHRVGICHYILRTVSCDAGWRLASATTLLASTAIHGRALLVAPRRLHKERTLLTTVNKGVLHCRGTPRQQPRAVCRRATDSSVGPVRFTAGLLRAILEDQFLSCLRRRPPWAVRAVVAAGANMACIGFQSFRCYYMRCQHQI